MCAQLSTRSQVGWEAYLRAERQLFERATRKVTDVRRALAGITGLVVLIVALKLANWFAL